MPSPLQLHTYILRLGKEAQGVPAAFTAHATAFKAAKGGAQVAQQPAVHPYYAAVHLAWPHG